MKPTEISELKQDTLNFNQGTYEGDILVERSLQRLKAGRSILIDKDNNIISGNKTAEVAARLGFKLRIIESDGTEMIAVKRTDMTLDSQKGREMAMADNATAQVNLSWNEENLNAAMQQYDGFDPLAWGIDPMSNMPTYESLGEVDTEQFDTDQTLKLAFGAVAYERVVSTLKRIDENLSRALLKILGYYGNV